MLGRLKIGSRELKNECKKAKRNYELVYHLSTRSCLTNYSPISASDRFQKTHESTTIMKRSWFFFCAPFVFRISGLLSAIIFNVVSMPMEIESYKFYALYRD